MVENKISNWRNFIQALPTNECSFKERGIKTVYLKNCCTISYVLLSFWTTCQIKPNFLIDIQKVGGIYMDISKSINMINEGA